MIPLLAFLAGAACATIALILRLQCSNDCLVPICTGKFVEISDLGDGKWGRKNLRTNLMSLQLSDAHVRQFEIDADHEIIVYATGRIVRQTIE